MSDAAEKSGVVKCECGSLGFAIRRPLIVSERVLVEWRANPVFKELRSKWEVKEGCEPVQTALSKSLAVPWLVWLCGLSAGLQRGHYLDSQSGQTPGLRARSPGGRV